MNSLEYENAWDDGFDEGRDQGEHDTWQKVQQALDDAYMEGVQDCLDAWLKYAKISK